MFEEGPTVLVHLVSGYYPAVFAGRVSRLMGPEGAELTDAVMVHECPQGHWAALAEGTDQQLRTRSTYEHAGTIRFAACAYVRDWVGALPKSNR